MASYNKKKRSFVAGIIGFIGSLVFVWGLYIILSEVFAIITKNGRNPGRIVLGILIIVLCGFIHYGSFMYDKFREHKKWKKRLQNAGILEELPNSKDLAWRAYRSNPTPMGLNFIEQYNPKAAAEIRRHLADNAKNPIERFISDFAHKYNKKRRRKVDEPVRVAVQTPVLKTEQAPVKKPAPSQTAAPAKKPAPSQTAAPVKKSVPSAEKPQPAKTTAQKAQPVRNTGNLSQDTQVVRTTPSEPRENQPVRKIPSLAKDKMPPKKTFKEKAVENLNKAAIAVIAFFKKLGKSFKSFGAAAAAGAGKAVNSAKALIANLKTKAAASKEPEDEMPAEAEASPEETVGK